MMGLLDNKGSVGTYKCQSVAKRKSNKSTVIVVNSLIANLSIREKEVILPINWKLLWQSGKSAKVCS